MRVSTEYEYYNITVEYYIQYSSRVVRSQFLFSFDPLDLKNLKTGAPVIKSFPSPVYYYIRCRYLPTFETAFEN